MIRMQVLRARLVSAGALLLLLLRPGITLAAEAAAHEQPGIINLNITILIQVINFLILILLLSKFLFKPLSKFMAERADGIERSLTEAKTAREATAKAQEENQARLRDAQREMATLREQVQREIETERQRLLAASREQAQALVAAAKAEIEADAKRARAGLREEAAGLALAAAERLLGRSMTAEDQRRLAEQYVRELGGAN